MLRDTILLAILAVGATAQVTYTTYTGCHNHSTIEYCYGSNGQETAVWTYSATTTTASTAASIPASVSATATITGQTTAVTGCHAHATDIFCINGNGQEVEVSLTATPTGPLPAQYTDCHAHGSNQYCVDPSGNDVLVLAAAISSDGTGESSTAEGEMDCHFHAGVEHCVPVGGSESGSSSAAKSCGLRERSYNVPLRVGTLFVILATSALGVFGPMMFTKLSTVSVNGTVFTIIKQFGTGIIISTAFVHLYTHAELMFANECLGRLLYEATTSAIVMAGIFLSFLVEYTGHRYILSRSKSALSTPTQSLTPTPSTNKEAIATTNATLTNLGHNHGSPFNPNNPNSKLSVMVMEAGILFHSILIGLTLVVAGDSYYTTLLVVVIFHQFFEGLALGARISLLPSTVRKSRFTPSSKFFMGLAFSCITPIGMAIGLGVLQRFNGNEKGTIVAIGTLDALSAGILAWVGLVDMWARDWVIEGGEMVEAPVKKVLCGGLSLVSGLVLMSLLGKWV